MKSILPRKIKKHVWTHNRVRNYTTTIQIMTESEFYQLVEQMRQAQIDYFRTRDKDCLRESKSLERKVDKQLEEFKLKQGNLF